MRVQLDLRAASVAEVTSVAGGWIFDQVRAGWVVTVWIPEHVDTRCLTILGAHVREWADAEDNCGGVPITVSGHDLAGGPPGGRQHMRHKLSTAARAFKIQALIAAGLPSSVAFHEEFWIVSSSGLWIPDAPVAQVISAVPIR